MPGTEMHPQKNTTEEKNLGPGVDKGWEPVDTGWKFKQEDGLPYQFLETGQQR